MRNGHGKIRTAENRRPFHTLKVSGAAAPLSNESLLVCLCCVRMYVHLYIGGMCDVNASFWRFLEFVVCLRKCVHVTICFCILLCRCWLALKRPMGCCFAVSHREEMSCSFHTRASSLLGGPIWLLSPMLGAVCHVFLTSPAELTAFFLVK